MLSDLLSAIRLWDWSDGCGFIQALFLPSIYLVDLIDLFFPLLLYLIAPKQSTSIITMRLAERSLQANSLRSNRVWWFLLEVEPCWRTTVTVCWGGLFYNGTLRSLQVKRRIWADLLEKRYVALQLIKKHKWEWRRWDLLNLWKDRYMPNQLQLIHFF